MRLHYILSFILLLTGFNLQAQVPEFAPHRPATMVRDAERGGAIFETPSLFSPKGTESSISEDPVLKHAVRRGTILNLEKATLATFNETPAEAMRLSVPTHEGTKVLKLVKVNIIEPDMVIRTSSLGDQILNLGTHYRGIVEGHTNSLAAVSIFESEVMGFFSSDEIGGNYVLGKIKDERNNEHIVYKDQDLMEPRGFGCEMEDDDLGYTASELLPTPPKEDAGDCVTVFIETNYNVYTNLSSNTQNVIDFIVGLFNQSITLYANESINMRISEILINTSPTSYSGSAKTIRNDWQAATSSINGDIGSFISRVGSGGSGIAAGFNGLCRSNVDNSLCVSKIALTFNTVPTYSRQVKVVTHEMGHLLGSRHTHACKWNGDNTSIDDYGNTDPGDGGVVRNNAEGKSCYVFPGKTNVTPTIMSYYDSRGWGGFSLGNGFGTQPGNVIRGKVASASCLSPCCDDPIANCKNISKNLNSSGMKSVGPGAVNNGSVYDCGFLSRELSPNQFTCSDVGANPVTLTVTDQAYRTASCSAIITINDVTAPQAKCDNITVFLNANGDAFFTGAQLDDGSTDACGIQSYNANPNSFHCPTIGVQTSTLTVTDNNGNTASCQAGVYVDDTNAKPDDLEPQNCGNCNQIRMWYCQFDPAPPSLNDFIDGTWQMNTGYVPGNGLYWYNDAGGSQGTPYAGNGSEPPVPNMNLATNTYWYWVAQIDQQSGCIGDAIRVRIRVRKTPILTFDTPPLPFCFGAQVNLAKFVEDANHVTDHYDFYDADPDLPGANLISSVAATNGVVDPFNYAIVAPQVGVNKYWVVAVNDGNNNSITCSAKASITIPVASPADLAVVPDKTVAHGDNVTVPFFSTNATNIIWIDHYSFNNPSIGLVGNMGLGNLSFTADNPGNSPITAMIRVIAYKGDCAGQIRDFFITVNPSNIRQGISNSLLVSAHKLNAQEVRVNWDIVYDGDLTRFEVERVKEGVTYVDEVSFLANSNNWERIGTVDYHSSQGSYSFTDKNGISNVTKYRLKLIHEDGTAVWSDVVEIRFDSFEGDRFIVFPNPSDGQFQLKSIVPITGEWNYQISDALGRILSDGLISANEQTFDLTTQTPGVYFLVLRNKAGMRYVKRVVKK